MMLKTQRNKIYRYLSIGLFAFQVEAAAAGDAILAAGDPELGTQLRTAVFNQNRGEVDRLLGLGAPVDSPDSSGYTPLMLAAHSRHDRTRPADPEIVRSLIVAGARLDGRDRGPMDPPYIDPMFCPVRFALIERDPRILGILLDAGARADVVVAGRTFLPEILHGHAASSPPGVRATDLECARLLIDAGVSTTGELSPNWGKNLILAGATLDEVLDLSRYAAKARRRAAVWEWRAWHPLP